MMGFFEYDGFLMTMLVKVGNMIIVSFFFLITCIPIVTIMPAFAAIYHTTVKVVRQSGTGVARDYFTHFRSSLRQGIPLSIICVVIGLLLYTALDFGRQTWQNGILWTAYYAIGFVLAFIYLTMLLFVPPTLSRFVCNVPTVLRLSLYFAARNLFRSVWYLVLLVIVSLAVYIYPITLLIIPGLYIDLICGGMEKTFDAYIKSNNLLVDSSSEEESPQTVEQEVTGLELARLLDDDPDDSSGISEDNHG